MDDTIDVEYMNREGVGIFRINDSIEIYLTTPLRDYISETVRAQELGKIVINMQKVPFIDSSGLGVFLNLQFFFDTDLKMRFCSLQPNVRAVFEHTNLLSHFDIDETEDESLQALR